MNRANACDAKDRPQLADSNVLAIPSKCWMTERTTKNVIRRSQATQGGLDDKVLCVVAIPWESSCRGGVSGS